VILSQPLDVSRYGVIYAGAQKNIGPAGLTLVIVRRDLLAPQPELPKQLSLHEHAAAGSMLNTPPTLAWYIAGQVFRWVIEQGGVAEMQARSISKSAALYAAIDGSDFYSAPVAEHWRSRMNVPFTLADPALEGRFLEQAQAAGLLNLAGHRSVGGMRASLYNAVTQASVDALIAFMADFEARTA
jgi:phosphoserine aminotransferase